MKLWLTAPTGATPVKQTFDRWQCDRILRLSIDFLNQVRYFLIKQLPNCPHEAGWTPFQEGRSVGHRHADHSANEMVRESGLFVQKSLFTLQIGVYRHSHSQFSIHRAVILFFRSWLQLYCQAPCVRIIVFRPQLPTNSTLNVPM